MPNKLIKVGGKERPVNFGRNFWAEVEELTGKPTHHLMKIEEIMSTKNGIAFVFAALKWGLYDPQTGEEPIADFTKAKVGDWIDERPNILLDVLGCLKDSLPFPKGALEKNVQAGV